MPTEVNQKKQALLPPLILGKLDGEPNDVFAEYAADVTHRAELRNVIRCLIEQQKLLLREQEELRTTITLQLAEQYTGDKLRWGNEEARKTTTALALKEAKAYQECQAEIDKLERELGEAKDEMSYFEESQQARRYWVKMYVAQAQLTVGATAEDMHLD